MTRSALLLRWGLPSLALALLAGWWFCLPTPLFATPPYAWVLEVEGRIASARAGADGQWRLPGAAAVPPRLAACVVAFEDRSFYTHWGLSPKAVGRAFRVNWQAGRVVQGGSTITMQVARLAGHRQGRSLGRKLLEAVQATRIEARYSKAEILALWAAHAPFGGNTVGLEAAAWRYYARPPAELTWAESATLAVLPNAPGLLHLSRGRVRLKARRDGLLRYLAGQGAISQEVLAQSLAEPLTEAALPLPNTQPHLLAEAMRRHPGGGWFRLTIDPQTQAAVEEALAHHRPALDALGVGNAACIVADNRTGRVLAYVGNAAASAEAAPYVDAAQAPRSYGSLLKPFLYALAVDRAVVTPRAWLSDVPQTYGAFTPSNFFAEYQGVVAADVALARSLNLPFVDLLERYGQRRFTAEVKRMGLGHLFRPADDYGLALILGSGEATLWEMARLYTRSAQKVQGLPGRFGVWQDSLGRSGFPATALPSAPALYAALGALKEANRPELDPYWQQIARGLPISWKTGTSQGLRDAWAVGCTPGHTVAVWCGNADGEGRPGLTGIQVAAPIVFEIAARLPGRRAGEGMAAPAGLAPLTLCRTSGYRASPQCPERVQEQLPAASARTPACPFHRPVYVDEAGRRVEAACFPLAQARPAADLHLPPLEDYYARKAQALPPPLAWLPGCAPTAVSSLRILTPGNHAILALPRPEPPATAPVLLLSATTTQPGQPLYWYLDGRPLGKTSGTARQSLKAELTPGPHRLVLLSEDGSHAESVFETR